MLVFWRRKGWKTVQIFEKKRRRWKHHGFKRCIVLKRKGLLGSSTKGRILWRGILSNFWKPPSQNPFWEPFSKLLFNCKNDSKPRSNNLFANPLPRNPCHNLLKTPWACALNLIGEKSGGGPGKNIVSRSYAWHCWGSGGDLFVFSTLVHISDLFFDSGVGKGLWDTGKVVKVQTP